MAGTPSDPLNLFGGGATPNPPAGTQQPPFSTDPTTGITTYWDGTHYVPVSAALQKVIDGTSSVAGAAQAYHLDPRELALEYAKLQTSLTTQQMSDLKDLISNRNTESVGLANAYGNIADNAAKFAANPQDAVAELMYRKAVGLNGQQATPFGSISNSQFQGYGNALADKFQALFGPSADALKRAGDFIGQIPPSEYLTAPTPSTPGSVFPAAAASAPAGGGGGGGGGGGSAPAAPSGNSAGGAPAGGSGGQISGAGPLGTPGPVPGMSTGGQVSVIPRPDIGGGYRVGASSSEGGTNMNVHEPAMIVGRSGHIYATMSENAPEQLIIKPLPSVQKAQKDSAAFMKATAGAQRNDAGGQITFGTDPAQFMDQLRQMFATRGLTTAPGSALPDPRLLAGDAGTDILNDPDLAGFTNAGYGALGINAPELKYTIDRFRPQGIRPELPKVVF